VERLWVFTEHAAGFSERCGWQPYGTAVEHGEPGAVLTGALIGWPAPVPVGSAR